MSAADAAADDAPADEPIGTSGAEPGGTESADEATRCRHAVTYVTGRWVVATAAALLAAGFGVVASRPGLLLAAVVGVGALAYRQASTVPTASLSVRRSITPADPDPGDVVEVETTIRNDGDATLVDCRLFDGVPEGLDVVEGSPRLGTAIRPGGSRTIRYAVRARQGHHEFGDARAIVADLAGTVEHEYRIESGDAVDCVPSPLPLSAAVLRSLTTPYAGRLTTDQPGEGLEFHATREYRSGDALRRIDWNQYASTGELATLQFRTERAASVVLLADLRSASFARADQDDDPATERVVNAVGRLFVTLLDQDHRAGVATLGPDYWLGPDAGGDHRTRGLYALGTDPSLSPTPNQDGYPARLRLRRLRRRLPSDAQVVLCSPLADDTAGTVARVLESHGHDVSVVAPDPTGDETPGQTVAGLERRHRIGRLRERGVPVVDWPPDASLAVAVARTARGWSE